MTDDLDEAVADVYEHLSATEEVPLDTTANRWIAEAQAVVADLHRGNPDPETVARRLETVVELLEEIDRTGNPDADARVEAASRRAAEVLGRDD